MQAVAKLKNIPLSARKMRKMTDLVRGKKVDNALNLLKFSKHEASEFLEKALLSAISNWEQKGNLAFNAEDHDLFIKEVFSDEGTFLKRFRPAPHGRAHRIRKRTNHVTIKVENKIAIDEPEVEATEE